MQIKYVGLKEEETAFSPETGITWYPGSTHNVPDHLAKRMLQHPDVFEADNAPSTKVVVPKTESAQSGDGGIGGGHGNPPTPEPPKFLMATPDGPLALDTIERDDLVALAKELGIKHHVNLGEDKLRALLVEKHPVKAE